MSAPLSRTCRILLFGLLALGLVVQTAAGPATAPHTPLSEGRQILAFQEEQYGALPADHPLTLQARELFGKLLHVSGKPPGIILELYVLETPKLLAQALPGGPIVISQGLVEFAGNDKNALAFILAHELAHQILGHHRFLTTYQQRLGIQTPQEPGRASPLPRPTPEEALVLQVIELEADRLGLLYASLAGYRARPALEGLRRLLAKMGPDRYHPNPEERAQTIMGRIAEIVDQLELFNLGLFYLALGEYRKAAGVLENFASIYPSPEVYNNLGVAYHKLALRWKPDDGLQRSLVIDPRSRARTTLRGPELRMFLQKAKDYYDLAIRTNPGYAIAHNNLGLAYLELREIEFALGEFERALKYDPQLKAAYNNRGIAYLQSRDFQKAEADFRQALGLDRNYLAPLMNLVELYKQQGRKEEEERAWKEINRLTAEGRALPVTDHETLEAIGGIFPGMDAAIINDRLGESLGQPMIVPLGLGRDEEVRLVIAGKKGFAMVLQRAQVEAVCALENSSARTQKGIGVKASKKQVQGTYGPPSWMEEVYSTDIWTYPERGLVFFFTNGRVTSWWTFTPQRS